MQCQREPFFKPLKSDHHITEIRHRQASNEKERQVQDFAINGERLTSLHAKLHQEADKIRKWKNSAEIDLKQKDRKIQEAGQTIDVLRKSLLDVQLQNESLSMNLQEEINNREDILQSVSSTRHLCSVLKEHLTKAETRIGICETEKTEVLTMEQEHQAQFELLSNKFKDLTCTSIEQRNKLTNQLNSAANENTKLKDKLHQQCAEAEAKLKNLEGQLDEKCVIIGNIKVQIHSNEEKIVEQEKAIETCQDTIKQMGERLQASVSMCGSIKVELESLQTSKSEVEETLKSRDVTIEELTGRNAELHTQLETLSAEHSQQIESLQKELSQQKANLDQKHTKLQFLEIDLEKTSNMLEDVKSSKDMLIMEKTELENRVRELEQQNAQLLAQHEQNCESLNQMSGSVTELQAQLSVSQQEGAAVMLQLTGARSQLQCMETEKADLEKRLGQFEADIQAKVTYIADLQKEIEEMSEQILHLTQTTELLNANLQTEQTTHEKTRSDLKAAQNDLSASKKEAGSRVRDAKKLQQDIESLGLKNTKLVQTIEEKDRETATLRKEMEEVQEELTLLQVENEGILAERDKNDETLHGKLESKEKAASDLDSKNKTLKSDLMAKSKQLKELEKEVKGLKSKLASSTKAAERKEEELSKLHSELKAELCEKDELRQKIEGMEADIEVLKTEASEKSSLAEQCVSEKETAVKECEAQRLEMMRIMENYKKDNDKNLAIKTTEVDTLKTKLENAKKKQNKETDTRVAQLETEIEQLRKTISDSGYQMENLQKTYGEKENKLQELEMENMKKDEELKGLQDELEKLFIKNNNTTLVLTSPYPDKSPIKPFSKIPTPRTPKAAKAEESSSSVGLDHRAVPKTPKTPQMIRTPAALSVKTPKTPSRSILKPATINSAVKKRRVVFATKDVDESSNSGESSSFEIMDLGDEKENCNKSEKIILMQSPKATPRTPDMSSVKKTSLSLVRTPRTPNLDMEKKRQKKNHNYSKKYDMQDEQPVIEDKPKTKKDKTSSTRKAPSKTAGKFFKNSPKSKLASFREKEKNKDMSWFENDDVFGFTNED